MSLKFKIFIIIFIAIFLPSVITNSLLYIIAEISVINQATKSIELSLNASIKSLDSSLNTLVGLSGIMNTEEDFVQQVAMANNMPSDSKQYSILYNMLRNRLARIKALNIIDDIDSFYIYLPSKKIIITTSTTYYDNVDISKISMIENGEKYKGLWYSAYPVNFFTLKGSSLNESLISFNHYIKDHYGEVVGICALNVKKTVFHEIFKNSIMNIPGRMLVFGEENKVLNEFSAQDTEIGELLALRDRFTCGDLGNNSKIKINGEDNLIICLSSDYTGWDYAGIIKSMDILKQLSEAKKFLLIIIGIIFLLVFVISFSIVRSFYKPIEQLVYAMQEIENRNFNVRISDKRRDEYQKVFIGFNSMAYELNMLIENLITEKLLNKEAKIKLLQEQINPHFLYNTLDSIYNIAKLQNIPEISQMVFALSKFFRVSLSGGKDIVSLKEAISIVVSYLTIQKIRFKGKFETELLVPNYLMKCRVPKLILQPFVENAIYHGLEAQKEKGCLKILASKKDGVLVLKVLDNGVGISKEKLLIIKESMTNDINDEGINFALKNLNMQIKMIYGPQYGVSIESEQWKGTEVVIKIPLNY